MIRPSWATMRMARAVPMIRAALTMSLAPSTKALPISSPLRRPTIPEKIPMARKTPAIGPISQRNLRMPKIMTAKPAAKTNRTRLWAPLTATFSITGLSTLSFRFFSRSSS